MNKEQILAEIAKHKADIESNKASWAKADAEIDHPETLAGIYSGLEKENEKLKAAIADLLLKLEGSA